jgi:hypothetical protein
VVTKRVLRRRRSGSQTSPHPDKPGGDEDRKAVLVPFWWSNTVPPGQAGW